MLSRFAVTAFLAAALGGVAAAQGKKDEPRTGTITGELKSKKEVDHGVVIEVLAPGEEKARAYHVKHDPKVKGPIPDVVKAVNAANVGDKVVFDWEATGHGPAIVKFGVLKKSGKEPAKDEKKDGKKDGKDEPRRGTVTGVVSAKGDNWIEVKADGEEKARRYVPHWRGGAPDKGGGPDKDMVAKIKETPLNARVRLEWEFEERARVVKVELLKKPSEKKDEK